MICSRVDGIIALQILADASKSDVKVLRALQNLAKGVQPKMPAVHMPEEGTRKHATFIALFICRIPHLIIEKYVQNFDWSQTTSFFYSKESFWSDYVKDAEDNETMKQIFDYRSLYKSLVL